MRLSYGLKHLNTPLRVIAARFVWIARRLLGFGFRRPSSRCLDRTIEEFGRLDILVNNAHTITHGLLLDATDADMEDEWRSGPYAVFRFMRLAHPHLAERGGVIVNFGSGAQALHDSKGWGVYGASKSAIQT